MAERASDRGRAKSLSLAAAPLPDLGGGAAQGRNIQGREMKRFAIVFGVLSALLGNSAQSDEIRPGYLELRQAAPDTYSLLFKLPALGDDLRLAIYVNLPEGTHDVTPPRAGFNVGAYTERRTIKRNGGLAGQTISIEGLSATSTDVLVRI